MSNIGHVIKVAAAHLYGKTLQNLLNETRYVALEIVVCRYYNDIKLSLTFTATSNFISQAFNAQKCLKTLDFQTVLWPVYWKIDMCNLLSWSFMLSAIFDIHDLYP